MAAKQKNGESTLVATSNNGSNLPSYIMEDMKEYGGAGSSFAGEDRTTPRIVLLQKNSPEVNERDDKYVKGAKPGMALNKATNELYDVEGPDGLKVIPVGTIRQQVEWKPRVGGAGGNAPIASHASDTPLLQQVKQVKDAATGKMLRILPNGNELIETVHQFVLLADTLDFSVISFTSTQLQAHRRWNDLRLLFKYPGTMTPLPSFANIYTLRSDWVKNDKGDWYTWKIDRDNVVSMTTKPEEVYVMAREFYGQVKRGEVPLGQPTEHPDTSDETIPI